MLKPLNDNVILKKEKLINKTTSGIILSTKESDDDIATVVEVGPGLYIDGKIIPLTITKNSKVIYKKYSTTEVKYNDEVYYVIAAKDILAVIEEE